MAHISDSRAPAAPPSREALVWTWFFFLGLAFWPRLIIAGFWIFSRQIGNAFPAG